MSFSRSIADRVRRLVTRMTGGPVGAFADERYHRLVNSLVHGVYVLDESGRFTEVNPAAERILQRSAAEILGCDFRTVLAPAHLDETTDVFRRVMNGSANDVKFETAIQTSSGEERLLSISTTAMREGGRIVGVYGIADDITEDRRVAEALRESEARYRRMVQTAPYVVYALDRAGCITELNESSVRTLGREPAELMGRSIAEFVAPEDLPKAMESLRVKHDGEDGMTELEVHIVRPDGERRLVHFRSTAIVRDGAVIGTHGVARDITDERATQLALRESEARFRQIAESLQDILWIFTPDFSETLYMSPAYETMFGYSLEEAYRDPTSFMKFVHPDDLARVLHTMETMGETGVMDEEYRVIRPDGSVRWIVVRGYPVRDADGNVIRYAGSTRDITEKRQTEDALRESEERLRQILGELPVGVVLTNARGEIMWHNPASDEIWGGVRYVDPSAYDVYRVWRPETGEQLRLDQMPLTLALRGTMVSGLVLDIESFDGARRTVINSAAPLRNASGDVTGALWAHQDITEARRLEAQRLTLASALEGLREGIALMTADGVVQYANAAYLQMMGVDRDRIPGFRLAEFARDPAVAAEQENNLRIARETGSWHGRIWRRRLNDGELVPFELNLGRVEGNHGGSIMLFGIAQEAAEQIEQERQLRRAERLGSLGTLIAGVAHELNNPLQSILNFTQMLQLEDGGRRAEQDIETIAREARRMAQIVGDLKRVARSTQDEATERDPVSLNDIVRHVLHVQNYGLSTNNIEVETDLAGDLPAVRADRAQVEQVMLNLVVNAKQAMANQPGRRLLSIRTRSSSRSVTLELADTGPGIERQHLERIFDPFFTTKPPGEGTGLGLSLVHSIVTEHGGEIRVDSVVGEGATFRIDLPPATVQEVAATRPDGEQPRCQSLRVLIVDDEASIRQVIARYLERRGHKVDQAPEGGAALELLKHAMYDVIVSDRRMPGMGGEALLDVLRARGFGGRLILLTGDPEGASEHTGKGDVRILLKPIELQEVARAVESIGRHNGDHAGSPASA